jgi:FMN-dependent NADH-azoreductase
MDTVIAEGFDLNPQKVPDIISKAKEDACIAAKELAKGIAAHV